jgi:hypothetical protein
MTAGNYFPALTLLLALVRVIKLLPKVTHYVKIW